jgi:hypothetical protein
LTNAPKPPLNRLLFAAPAHTPQVIGGTDEIVASAIRGVVHFSLIPDEMAPKEPASYVVFGLYVIVKELISCEKSFSPASRP